MSDELAEKLAEGLHFLTFDKDMNGYSMEVEELKELIIDIAEEQR